MVYSTFHLCLEVLTQLYKDKTPGVPPESIVEKGVYVIRVGKPGHEECVATRVEKLEDEGDGLVSVTTNNCIMFLKTFASEVVAGPFFVE